MEELSTELRKGEVKDVLEFGNHKGACEKPELLKKLAYKDVTVRIVRLRTYGRITQFLYLNIQQQGFLV